MMPTHLFLHKPYQFIMKYGTYQVWDLLIRVPVYNFLIYEQTNQFQSYPSIVFNGLITYPSCCQSIICDSWSVYRWLFCFTSIYIYLFTIRQIIAKYICNTINFKPKLYKENLANICEIHLYCPIWLQLIKFRNL